MDVDIVELPEQRVATVSHRGPYHEISEAFGRLGQAAGAAGLFGPGAAMLAIYHDDPRTTPVDQLRSEAGIVVAPSKQIPEGLNERVIPAGRFARTKWVGPYEDLPAVWQRFMGEWLPASGHRMRDPMSLEIYRNTPGQVPRERLITELYIAIA